MTDGDTAESADPYQKWREQYKNVNPFEGDAIVEERDMNKRDYRKFEIGAETKARAFEAGRCAAEMDNGRYCVCLPKSADVEGASDRCYKHAESG